MTISSSSPSGLSSYFTNLINSIMTVEAQPLQRLQTQKTTLNNQRSVYSSLQTKMAGLKDSLQYLMSSSPFFSLKLGRTTSVGNPSTTDATVLSASADSTATAGDYNIFVNQLATAQSRVSSQQSSTNQSLGFTDDWSFYLGGLGTASAAIQGIPTGMVSGATNVEVNASYHELDSGTYTVETRYSGADLQFRLKDSDGGTYVAVGADSSSDWQTVTPGSDYDTLRGLKISFATSGDAAATTTVSYTARGSLISVSKDDSLVAIANKINSASQPENSAVNATVVGKQMVLTSSKTGTGHRMVYSSELATKLGFGSDLDNRALDLKSDQNAQFTVNGLPSTDYFVSKTNSGIDDVINGVTLNLANDARQKSATLTVAGSTDEAVETIKTFLSKFNDLQSYLQTQTAVTKNNDNTYTRGPLANDSMFSSFRIDMFSLFLEPVSTTGKYSSLSSLGLTVDSNLQVSISDEDKLKDALQNNMSDVQTMFNGVMKSFDDRLSVYTGSSGYLPGAISSIDSEVTDIGVDITDLTNRLNARYSSLQVQYGNLQSQLLLMSYQQQMFSSIMSTTSTYT